MHRAPFPQATPACTLSRMKRPATYAQAKDSTDTNNMECSLDAGAGFHIDSGKEDHRSMTAVSSSTAFAGTTPMEDKPAFLGGMPEPDERRGHALIRHAGSGRRANSIRPKSAAQVAAPLTKRFRTADRRVDLTEFTDVIRRNEPSVPRVAFMLRHKIVGKALIEAMPAPSPLKTHRKNGHCDATRKQRYPVGHAHRPPLYARQSHCVQLRRAVRADARHGGNFIHSLARDRRRSGQPRT